MSMVPDKRRVALIAYSFWAQILGLAALIAPEVRFLLTGQDTDPRALWLIGLGLSCFGIIGRFVQQKGSARRNLAKTIAIAALIIAASFVAANAKGDPPRPTPVAESAASSEAATLDIAVPFIARWEGKRNEAYLDIVNVPTICYGSTRGVILGMWLSDAACLSLLRAEVVEYRLGIRKHFTQDTLLWRLPAPRDAAFTSFAFNVGIAGAGNSTAVKRLNAANISGACEALTWWNRAGRRVIRGLAVRRSEERDLCMVGVRA